MRLAFISDIHANLQAFQAVLTDIEKLQATEIFSLGDNIGYGPQPEEVINLLRKRNIASIMGNHEYALLSSNYCKSLNPSARKSISITRQLISDDTLSFISSLPPFRIVLGCRCVHGCPPDSIVRYLYAPSDERLLRLLRFFPEPLCFFGHTHNLAIYARDEDGAIEKRRLKQEKLVFDEKRRAIINIGSVGQPRDGDYSAKYVLYDSEEHSVEIRYVPYDATETKELILALGFPEFNATRLG
ncbi:MAG: metallophosphoesterase family protein [Deltaproteobacteria bacterium]